MSPPLLLNLSSRGSNHVIPQFKIPSGFSFHSEKKIQILTEATRPCRTGPLISSRYHLLLLSLQTSGHPPTQHISCHLRQFVLPGPSARPTLLPGICKVQFLKSFTKCHLFREASFIFLCLKLLYWGGGEG